MDTESYPVVADTEGGHVVVSVSLKFEMAMNTEPYPIADYSYGKLSHGKFRIPMNHAELPSTALTTDDLDTPRGSHAYSVVCSSPIYLW